MVTESLDQIESLVLNHDLNQTHFKIKSCIHVLRQSEGIIEAFLAKSEIENTSEVLIHIYGLLQNMFVSIDALYDLTKLTMSNKYAVNVNQNKNLRELKYIRNDIVGHPTHRTYSTGGVGFSLFSIPETSMMTITYETHFFKQKAHEVFKHHISTQELIEDYHQESRMIIDEIAMHLRKDTFKPELSILAKQFMDGILLQSFDGNLLDRIQSSFLQNRDIPRDSHNRLIWRIELLNLLNKWRESDEEKREFVEYMKAEQAYKIYEMTSHIESIEPQYVKIEHPALLVSFFKFIRENGTREKYLKYLKSFDHPYHYEDLKELLEDAKNNLRVRKLLTWLQKQTSEQRIFLIGSALEKYKRTESISD
ncbi:hypothetical protein N7603_07115 [Acholeplasma vituli]|uniref:Uncharacterized protein n=1 Tax=Paracholeplasma vituli TaxID=69473 RepID=A0ABT2PYI4_9MOLU|nr:hypothetical protein [Paracholeplasma vituli]MCU0105424.1 hypothetical protein [Paracholeplasma vituli]